MDCCVGDLTSFHFIISDLIPICKGCLNRWSRGFFSASQFPIVSSVFEEKLGKYLMIGKFIRAWPYETEFRVGAVIQ